MDPRFRPGGCARGPPHTCQRAALWTHAAFPYACLASNRGSGTRGESNGPCGATKRRATKRRFRPKRGLRATPRATGNSGQGCNREFGRRGVEKRDLLHQMGSDPVCFSIDPVLVRNIVAATPGAGRAPPRGGRFSKNDRANHLRGVGFGPPFLGRGRRRAAPHACQRAALWTHARSHRLSDIKSGPRTRDESNGPRGATKRRATKRRFRPKRGCAQHPVQPREFGPKGVEKRDLLHQMGSDPVCFSIDPVLVRNIVAATPGVGRAPA